MPTAINNIKTRNYNLVLYPQEDKSHNEALEYIKSHYRYAYIIHDRDIDDNGELKKPHAHIVISFKNARSLTSLSVELNIEPNRIEACRDLDSSLCYLIHYYDKEKFQYSCDLVQGPLRNKLNKLIINDNLLDEDDAVLYLHDFIDKRDSFVSTSDFLKYCCSNGLFSYYRRSANIMHRLIDEHNSIIRLKTDVNDEIYKVQLETGELSPTTEDIWRNHYEK